jgi:hypothetical protein
MLCRLRIVDQNGCQHSLEGFHLIILLQHLVHNLQVLETKPFVGSYGVSDPGFDRLYQQKLDRCRHIQSSRIEGGLTRDAI